jgi:predicted metal-binding transcription factor (methanogenesis marker protein 9)
MAGYYMKEMTVPIPDDRRVVIRREKTVEYEIDRNRSEDKGDTRVTRRVIGKVDPVNLGRMFPNEMYFQLFPENEVPEEVRDEFLRGCEIKRRMQEIRRSPEEIIEGVVNGLSELGCGRNVGDGSLVPHSCNCEKPSPCSEKSLSYVLLRRLFDDIYYAIEELASKYPNEVIAPFKVKQINEVLEEIRKNVDDEGILPYLRLIEEPGITEENGSTIIKGLTYSDVLLMMKWYKVLPR